MVNALEARFETAFAQMPLVAILRGVPAGRAQSILAILVEAGFTLIEVPLTSDDAMDAITQMLAVKPDHVMVGAGTVLSEEKVRKVEAIGGEFIVTPNTDAAVIAAAKALGVPSCIGCLTPTEALAATHAGATILKIFPAARMGGAYIKDVKVVLPPSMRVLAVGGVGPDSFAEYVAAGAAGFGIGSDLWKPERTDDDVRKAAQALVEKWRSMP